MSTTMVMEDVKEDENTPTSEVIDASERAEQNALIHDHDRYRNYGFVGEIITVSEGTLAELKGILRQSKHPSVDILLDCFHRASANAESNEYFSCFYDAKSRLLGTDIREQWTIPEFYEFSKPHFSRKPLHEYARPYFHTRNVLPGGRNYSIFPDEGSPSFATFEEVFENKVLGGFSRGSGTLCFEGGFWYIVSYNLSFPIPNEIALETCKRVHVWELAVKRRSQKFEIKCVCGLWLCGVCMEQKDDVPCFC